MLDLETGMATLRYATDEARELYRDIVLTTRKMFHECRLVHGDLSEFNLLYHEGRAYFIDVSQSVEHDHPHALEFLRKDLVNVNDFFRRKFPNPNVSKADWISVILESDWEFLTAIGVGVVLHPRGRSKWPDVVLY